MSTEVIDPAFQSLRSIFSCLLAADFFSGRVDISDEVLEVGKMELKKTPSSVETSPVVFVRARSLKEHVTTYVEAQIDKKNLNNHEKFKDELWIKICVSIKSRDFMVGMAFSILIVFPVF